MVCHSAGTISRDHVFPESIGGRYWVDFVCRKCNSNFGTSFDKDLKQNAFVDAAVRQLGLSQRPGRPKGEKITWTSPDGLSGDGARLKADGPPIIAPSTQKDGDRITDETIFREQIRSQLRREGWSEDFVEHSLTVLDRTPSGLAIRVPGTDGWSIPHRNAPVQFQITSPNAPFRYALLGKIAVELYLKGGLWADFPVDLSQTVAAVRENRAGDFSVGRPDYGKWEPDKLTYKPLHMAAFAVLNKHLVCLIEFFGCLPFAICLGRLKTQSVGNCQTDDYEFPFDGCMKVLRTIPDLARREAQYLLMVKALGEWLRKHPDEVTQ